MGRLIGFESLDLSANALSEPIPLELADFYSLVTLDLSENALSGEIPPALGSLQRLGYLGRWKNHASGQVPLSFGNLADLTHLYLDTSNLAGALPFELVQRSRREEFHAYGTSVCAQREVHFQFWLARVSFKGAHSPPDDESVVDVAVAYTRGARTYLGSAGSLRAEVGQMIVDTNYACAQGGIDLRISLAALSEVNYFETDSSTDLNRLRATEDAYLNEVHELRDTAGADVVVLLVDPRGWSDKDYSVRNGVPANWWLALEVLRVRCLRGHAVRLWLGDLRPRAGTRHGQRPDNRSPSLGWC